MSENFGMMDKAYFMSKNEIINWINSTLKVGITKIEQCATGAIYCQLLDAIFPGKVNMKKVNWAATMETEFLANYKIFQQGLNACGVKKEIDVQRLAKGRYQDNFEFCQWFRGFYNSSNKQGFEYDAVFKRNGAVLTYLNPNVKAANQAGKNTTSRNFQAKVGGKNNLNEKGHNNKSHDHANKENFNKGGSLNQRKVIPQKQTNITTIKHTTNNMHEQPASKMQSKDVKMEESPSTSIQQPSFEELLQNPEFKEKVDAYAASLVEQKSKELMDQFISENSVKETTIAQKEEEILKNQESINNLTSENFKLKGDLENVKLTLADCSTERDFYFNKLQCIGFLSSKSNSLDYSEFKTLLLKLLENPYDVDVRVNDNDVPELIENQSQMN